MSRTAAVLWGGFQPVFADLRARAAAEQPSAAAENDPICNSARRNGRGIEVGVVLGHSPPGRPIYFIKRGNHCE
jgi:hypothetical protein